MKSAETYDFKAIEQKWQKIWAEQKPVPAATNQQKFYCLVMFPYPSGKIHMGHARNYCIGDVIARYKKMRGFSVIHPIGWDAFGLPAENAAIERKINPADWTYQNISDMRNDIKLLGIAYDWEREFATCDPEYYRWNQWFFIQMFNRGLAYKKKSAVNWCTKCLTVLANEQVHDGKCWRCGTPVTQKELEQWFWKITDYAERLLEDSKMLEGQWPDEVLTMQRNWIGKSEGAEVDFKVDGGERNIRVFTTRPDTLFGCTFLVLSPEHAIVQEVLQKNANPEIKAYCEAAKKKSKFERTAADKEKTGVPSGLSAINPVNQKKVPIWIADYVLSDYGTGAIMAVPAHDQRDFDFAKKYQLPIIQVIEPKNSDDKNAKGAAKDQAYEAEGNLINSGEFNGLPFDQAKKKIAAWLSSKNLGKESINYRLRDWLISRQRYWGTPIPILYCPKCGAVPAAEKDLPVRLPKNVQFTGQGQSPLAQVPEFVNAPCPKCGGAAKRETDTMDTFVDSSWYFLRYTDAKNDKVPFDSTVADKAMPVDQYIGGIEHACMHLVYSRFFNKIVYDLGMTKHKEPFQRLLTQGMVTLGGAAMSKSRGNIVAVEQMANEFGADTARVFILFASPPRNQLEWSEDGVQGSWRFLNRIWRLGLKISGKGVDETGALAGTTATSASAKTSAAPATPAAQAALRKKTHQTIKRVQDDIERDFQFNTAISGMMELLNAISDYPNTDDEPAREAYQALLALLFPFAPHITSELWEMCGCAPKHLNEASFPKFDPELIKDKELEIVVQVNGRLRGKISVPAESAAKEAAVIELAKKMIAAKNPGEDLSKYKFVPGRLVNFIVAAAAASEASK